MHLLAGASGDGMVAMVGVLGSRVFARMGAVSIDAGRRVVVGLD
jgi:hypothetical protein